MVYGCLYILRLWGMAAHPDPGFSSAWRYVWLVGAASLFLFGWSISRSANLQKYTFKRWSDRKFLGFITPKYMKAGDRKILYSGLWGVARHFNYMGECLFALSIALAFGHFVNAWARTYMALWSRCSSSASVMTTGYVPRNTVPRGGQSIRHE